MKAAHLLTLLLLAAKGIGLDVDPIRDEEERVIVAHDRIVGRKGPERDAWIALYRQYQIAYNSP